jgi:alpha-galactosidase
VETNFNPSPARAGFTLEMKRLFVITNLIALAALIPPAGHAAAEPREANGVTVSEEGRFLTLDSGALILKLELAPEGAVLLSSLQRHNTDHEWAKKGSSGGFNLSSDLIKVTGLSSGNGFRHLSHSQRPKPRGGTEVNINLEHQPTKLLATLLITAYPNSPIMDWGVRLKNNGDGVVRNLSRYDPVSLSVPARAKPYVAHWVTRNSYALHEADLGESLTVDGGNWNGPNAAGWLALEDPEHGAFLVAGIEWERHWAFDLRQEIDGKGYRFSAGLRRGSTLDLAPGATLESPHIFVGLAQGDLDDAANLTQDYLQAYVLPPKLPGFPFVCYDIWSTEGENVEQRILAEARFAAETLGVEVFYHDASWYRDSDVTNKERWGVGLGNYSEDQRKLPTGLRHLSDIVHGLGMKFGLWVCPEMVDVTIMGREGISDAWMTMANGQFNVQNIGGWNPMKMLCLGNADVEKHLQKNLLRIIEDLKLDWLKWDASGLPGLDIVCNHADHGHQAGNGSQAAVLGKYRLLDAIQEKFPALIIEQCSYGTRLDYGMGRHGARVNWLSDSTAPSTHVRDNVMAAAFVLPSSHNMTWIMRDDEVSQPQTTAFLDTMFRSRMMGSFGFGTLHGSLGECISLYPPSVIEAAARNVKNYKHYRPLLSEHVYHLTAWGKTNDWQGMQFAARDREESVAFFFRNGSTEISRRFGLRGLDARKVYQTISLNTGLTNVIRGAELMQPGVQVPLEREPQQSEILWLKAKAP